MNEIWWKRNQILSERQRRGEGPGLDATQKEQYYYKLIELLEAPSEESEHIGIALTSRRYYFQPGE